MSWFTRLLSVTVPLVLVLLLYRWKIGALDSVIAPAVVVLMLPLMFLPWAADRVSLRVKAGALLLAFGLSAGFDFASSGIEGIGPLLSLIAGFTAFLFFGNFSFLIVCSLFFVAIWASAFARTQGLLVPVVDFDLPVNALGRALPIPLVLGVILYVLRTVVSLLVEQRNLAARNNAWSDMALNELDSFIESANAPIFGIDPNGRINEWNAQAALITGYSKVEALGNNLVETYITDEYKASVSDVLARALAGTNTANYEFPIYSRGGGRVEILLNATTRRDVEGTIVGVMGVGQDITLYREQERRLRQAQKMESVGQLTGGIAHDFNNILTVISANLELAVFEVDNAEEVPAIKELLNDAASAANDGAYLTSQLLSFASLQSFKLDSFNLQTLVSDIIRKASATFPSGIKCSVRIESDDITVMVDRVRLESSILNLLTNASAAIENRGSISVLCQTKQFRKSEEAADHGVPVGEYIVISVSDDGCGISESLLDQVKDPFFTTKGVGAGTGLGLSMVDSFATKLGGGLRIQSTVGLGTIVTILIPLVRSEAGTPIEKANAQQRTSVPQEAKTVLVVEDEARIRKITVRYLVSGGFRCIEAGDAAQALAILAAEAEGIDILFSDIRMPGDMTGRDLAAEVARLYPRIKTGLTTGYDQTTRSPGMTGTDADTENIPEISLCEGCVFGLEKR
ncbi:MAG: PAS domain-containing protein [Proteobacteria bacterium]|nr:PAS domain-containing protein [Pseudomonadota bacterium]